MNNARFEALIEALEATPENQFLLTDWQRCAVGHYLRRNPQCGLELRWMEVKTVLPAIQIPFVQWAWMLIDPATEATGFTAAAAHFGLSTEEASRLFSPAEYEARDKCVVLGRLVAFYEGHRSKSFGEKIMQHLSAGHS